MSVPVTLMDGVDGETYMIDVTSEEATRINSDMEFAAEMLNRCKKHFHSAQQHEANTDEQTPVNNTNDELNLFKWPHKAVLVLIEEYRKMADNFGLGRISQKKIWQSISNELINKSYNVTCPQCQSKFGGLKRTYKSIKDHNNKSGNGTRTWPYFDLLDGLLGIKPNITPIATASSTGKRDQLETKSSSPCHDHSKKKSNYLSPVDKVLTAMEENRKIAEENRERRHKEKMEQKKEAMDLLSRFCSLLEKKKKAEYYNHLLVM